MNQLFQLILPELILTAAACVLFLMGCSGKASVRRLAGILAVAALLMAFGSQWGRDYGQPVTGAGDGQLINLSSLQIGEMAHYLRLLALLVGALLALLSFPTDPDATGNLAMHYGKDAPEYFGFLLLSVTGLLLLCSANDLIVLFLALELVSMPTYVMVSMSRTTPLAQEAGLKYFFLGALSVALMLLGFSYLFGATGQINLDAISAKLQASMAAGALPGWQLFAVVLLLLGFAFKMAAFPLHFYAGDVYEGAGTGVTAFLAFVPKAAGVVATIKLLQTVGGPEVHLPAQLQTLLWVMAAVTMTVGNVLGLRQTNVKRVLAYSSIAHSGYMLVGLVALGQASGGVPVASAMHGVIFYLTAYGLMNVAAFGVLMLLPARDGHGSAETYEDIAGQGRRHVGLGLAMAVSCFSLIGLPLTIGFFGKLFLIRPALETGNIWLVVLLVVNAAISAGYYLWIVTTMFLRPATGSQEIQAPRQAPVLAAVVLSAIGTLALGTIPSLTSTLSNYVDSASQVHSSGLSARVETPALSLAK